MANSFSRTFVPDATGTRQTGVLSLLPFSPEGGKTEAFFAGASEEAGVCVLSVEAEGRAVAVGLTVSSLELPQAQVPVMIILKITEKSALCSFTFIYGFFTMQTTK